MYLILELFIIDYLFNKTCDDIIDIDKDLLDAQEVFDNVWRYQTIQCLLYYIHCFSVVKHYQKYETPSLGNRHHYLNPINCHIRDSAQCCLHVEVRIASQVVMAKSQNGNQLSFHIVCNEFL